MNLLEIKNLTYSFDKKRVFDNINLKVQDNTFISIAGKNCCGKTTLIKILSGNIITNNKISINNIMINPLNKDLIDKEVFVFSPDKQCYSKTVLDELLMDLDNDNLILGKIKKYLKEFNLLEYLNKSPQILNYVERQKLSLIKAIIRKSKLLLMDNIFCYFDKFSKIEFITLLKKYQQELKFSIVLTINNLEDSIFTDRLIIINNGKILEDSSPDQIYKKEKTLKMVDLKLPFNYELFNKLKLYNLIEGQSVDIDDMVNQICK